jgi:hypothetical protein
MRLYKTIIFPFLLLSVFCFGQSTGSKELYTLFQGIPVDSSLNFMAEYCKQHNCTTQKNIYDNTKTDFLVKNVNYSFSVKNPTSVSFSNYYAYKYALGDTIPNQTRISSLTVSYQDTLTKYAKKEYESLIKRFKKIYSHFKKTYLISEHGREGEWVKFYLSKTSKLPMLTIELNYPSENSLWKVSSVTINYIRPYANEMNN